MYGWLRKSLFMLPPEAAHEVALKSLCAGQLVGLPRLMAGRPPARPVSLMGLEFPNPVGLAAGLDKNGDYIDALGGLGFGFIEVGTVTPKPQAGNARPRMFRLPEHQAIINRLGFNNKGVDHLVANLARRRFKGIVGANIGKQKETPVDEAPRSEEHTSELQSRGHLVCRLLLEKKNKQIPNIFTAHEEQYEWKNERGGKGPLLSSMQIRTGDEIVDD